jgi:hypothetical protein
MTTVAVGQRYVARVSRIEAFRCGPVGVSGAVFCRERMPEPRRDAKQLKSKCKGVS